MTSTLFGNFGTTIGKIKKIITTWAKLTQHQKSTGRRRFYLFQNFFLSVKIHCTYFINITTNKSAIHMSIKKLMLKLKLVCDVYT